MDKFTLSISNSLAENGFIKADEIEIYKYGIEMFVICVLEIAAVLLLSVVVGNFSETVCFLVGFIPIRTYSGGYHANSRLSCFLIFLAVYAIFSVANSYLFIRQIGAFTIIMPAANLILACMWAPLSNENKSINEKEQTYFRKKSILFSAVAVVLIVVCVVSNAYNAYTQAFLLGLFLAFVTLIAGKIKNTMKGGENK